MTHVTMRCRAKGGAGERTVRVERLIIAGWTSRDAEALRKHIAELQAIGVSAPSTVPCFYPVAPSLLTTASEIKTSGSETSGEVEFALFALEDGLWIGVGSDHTDRKAETFSVAVSKQACPKPVAPELWSYAEVSDHWDRLILRSTSGGRLYQEGPVGLIRTPEELIRSCPLPAGSVMFGGTLPALAPLGPSPRFEFELEDPILRRKIRHAYDVRALP